MLNCFCACREKTGTRKKIKQKNKKQVKFLRAYFEEADCIGDRSMSLLNMTPEPLTTGAQSLDFNLRMWTQIELSTR